MGLGPVTAGAPEPLGVVPTATGVNVAVASTAATAIDFCLFADDGEERRVRLPERTGEVFHGHVAGVAEGARYGLRAHGPYDPARGLRFDPSKLLLDPYAVAIDRPLQLDPALFAAPFEGVDSAPVMAKGVVMPPAPATPPPLVIPWDRTVIYEAHVRGLTKLHPAVPEAIRGTFAALAHPAVLDHLTALGVTTLELLPCAAWIDERHLPPLGLTNYWGYNPIAFCAPDPRLAPGGWAEIRAATSALAGAGVEVVLDVVFNHTGEGDAAGPTLSLRGLDNSGFYRLPPDDPAGYVDDAGTGNTLRLDAPQGARLVMEALRTWARRGGVAGFRFDLATVMGRKADGFDPAALLLTAIMQDPELRALKLVAEPWDCGPGGYQLGRFPAAWGEWNDRFRDTVRRFWRGSDASLGDLAARLSGSQDAFAARHKPSRSINFVTAHDGFTLADLVSYETKRNTANGEQNRDGSDSNWSWNSGIEGPTDDPTIQARRIADQRALLATLVLARGTPMLAMGAELGQSQGGNNNAYAQDNATSWLDWADPSLTAFVGRLTKARRDHPALRRDRFLTGEALESPWPDVAWRRADGASLQPQDWDDPQGEALQMVLTAPDTSGDLDRVAILVHRGAAPLTAHLPQPRDGHAWRLILDSADETRGGPIDDEALPLSPRSVVLLAETRSRRKPQGADDALVAELAQAAGVAPDWWTLDGQRHEVSPQTKRALLAAMDLPAATGDDARDSLWRLRRDQRDALPACRVAREGEPLVLPVRSPERWLTIDGEDGALRSIQITGPEARLPDLPAGRYALGLGDAQGRLIVAPKTAFEPEVLADGGRLFGLSVQLYALRRRGDQGVGDFTTLAGLVQTAAAEGAGLVAINPLHALFPGDRSRASPYHPSDRRFIDPLYLDLEKIPGAGPQPAAAGLSALPEVDLPAVWAMKSKALEAAVAAIEAEGWERADFEAFVQSQGAALDAFCAFQAMAEAHPGRPWSQWPQDLQTPLGPKVAEFAAAHPNRIRFHQMVQWLCDRQLREAAARAGGLGLCRDLAVGAAADGVEAWAAAGRWALSASIGAPPDAFAPQGQVWALPPPIPHRWTDEGYDGFAELVRANMRHAGALRIDHILGLERLFWTPEGAEGADGAYVSYPVQDLLGVLALESRRAGCLVIGEDLGTTPEGLEKSLGDSRVYGYSVLRFERDGEAFRAPSDYRIKALACAATHDLPPLAGWWAGTDLEERRALGLLPADDVEPANAERQAEKAALLTAIAAAGLGDGWMADSPFSPELCAAIHAYVAASASQLALVQVEDLAGERIALNMPGTDRERPNWRRRPEMSLEQLGRTKLSRLVLARVRAERPPLTAPRAPPPPRH